MKHDNQTDSIIAGFLPWVEQQPADKAYNYTDSCGCAFAQYLHAIGFSEATVWPGHFGLTKTETRLTETRLMPDGIEAAVHGPYTGSLDKQRKTWTFGQLADRLREAV